ncbi:7TM diverse intracellular signaling domain-containing protein [Cyclobacterium sp. 1_MG-2023]|uniref:hybrid sensor histidine kinase/response regulator n=1 Tax=Cyclobacterium sp. 1_MG-2023 TaxID=3062681 RepID=UPI0026E44FF9|nr:hybrid sensor histidine kinase/response regulator [Cyclobacterium sp. 1_MG-2023]MDO6439139.1 7TM diverse intracellular signaling domain-containing protein [Cyclobacterium sp. 1_MG-2023]
MIYFTKACFFILITFFYSVNAFSYGLKPYNAQNNKNYHSTSLYQYAEIANVGDSNFTFEEFLANENKLKFDPITGPSTNLSFTNNKYWLRFNIKNVSEIPLQYFLETGRPVTDIVDLYMVTAGEPVQEMKNGDLIPFANKSFAHRKIIFPLNLDPGKTYNIYIQYISDGEVINLPLELHSSTSMVLSTYQNQLFHGVFYGILLLAGAVYLLFYFGIGEKSFLLYSIYVLSVGLLHMSLDGYFFQYIDPRSGWLNKNAILISATLSAMAFGRYAQIYTNVKRWSNTLNKGLNIMLSTLVILITLVVIYPDGKQFYYPSVNLLSFILLLILISTVIFGYVKGKKIDLFFSLAIFSFTIGFIILIFNNFSLIPNSFFTENASKIGTGLEIIFLSLAMSNRIKLLKSEKEKHQEIALQKAEESNEIKSYFLSNISHELRTPLNAIIGLTESIKETSKDDAVCSDLEVIHYSSLGLLGAIDDVLDYSKIEKGELKLQDTAFDLRKMINQIAHSYATQAKDKGLDFNFKEIGIIPQLVNGDKRRTEQLIGNVLKNAIKFTQQGEIEFEVEAKSQDENRCQLKIQVRDSGVGIKKQKLESIFASFSQGQNNDKRKFGGLGLGLCIVKALVDLHQGKIDIQSEEGKGTLVALELNYSLPETGEQTDIYDFAKTGVFDLENKNILIVEDNALNQMVLKVILGKWANTSFKIANNGLEGVEMLREQAFDVVLMDLQMPVMDGYEATQAIRSGASGAINSKIPIIAVTADVTQKARNKVFEIGMDDYMTKPVKKDEVYNKIKKVLL